MLDIADYARRRKIDFAAVNNAAASHIPSLARTWLPDGRRQGREWVALNLRRGDKRLGSFSVNTVTGQWADFATGDRGGDIISLGAYLFNTTQLESAQILAAILGVRS